MKSILPILFLCGLICSSEYVSAEELVVVVNAESGIEKLTREQVINIFLGRFRQLPSGMIAQPIDQPQMQPEKALFYKLLVGKELSEINSYWARLVFAGKTQPPQQSQDINELLIRIKNTPGAIAYLKKDQIVPQIKIVLNLN